MNATTGSVNADIRAALERIVERAQAQGSDREQVRIPSLLIEDACDALRAADALRDRANWAEVRDRNYGETLYVHSTGRARIWRTRIGQPWRFEVDASRRIEFMRGSLDKVKAKVHARIVERPHVVQTVRIRGMEVKL